MGGILLVAGILPVAISGSGTGKMRSRSAIGLFLLLFSFVAGAVRGECEVRQWEKRDEVCRTLENCFVEIRGEAAAVEDRGEYWTVVLKGNEVWDLRGRWGENQGDSWKNKKGPAENTLEREGSMRIPCVEISFKKEDIPEWKVKIGMMVAATGKVELFSTARNPGEFDSREYYHALGVDCRMKGENLEWCGGQSKPLPELLRRLRELGKRGIFRSAAEEDAGIFCAAVLGDKRELSGEIKALYQKNGIAHLLAISGLHLSLIGMGIYRLLRKTGAGYGTAGGIGVCFIVCYGMMTGSSASVQRAVIMMAVSFLASYLGRTYDLLSSASLALLLIAGESPLLLTQGGVQLSFGAILSIGGLGPAIGEVLGGALEGKNAVIPGDKHSKCSQVISVSLAIWLGTLPIVLYHFFQFPPYGIFLNLLVVPLMGGVVCSGIGASILGNLWPVLGVAAAGPGHYILNVYDVVCQLAERLPGHTLVWGRPELAESVLYYTLLVGGLGGLNYIAGKCKTEDESKPVDKRKSVDKRNSADESKPAAIFLRLISRKFLKFRLLLFLSTVFLCLAILLPRPVEGLEVIFMDVGQGDGILLRTGRTVILIDGGSTTEKSLGKYRLEPCIKSLGISKIDYAFISHGDADHLSGVTYLLESCGEVEIKKLLISCQGKEDEALTALAELTRQRGGEVKYLTAKEQIKVENLTVTCLYPGERDVPTDKNEESEVLKVDYGKCHLLFTGDMSEEGEARLLEALKAEGEEMILKEIQILKVAHHGSRYSSTEGFLDALGVRWAILSYAEGNSYGHPHEETVERLESRGVQLYRTAESGAVTLWTDGVRVRWREFLH